jgi:hypothetical protein
MFGITQRDTLVAFRETPPPIGRALVVEDEQGEIRVIGHTTLTYPWIVQPIGSDVRIAHSNVNSTFYVPIGHDGINPIPHSPEDWLEEGSLVFDFCDHKRRGDHDGLFLIGQYFMSLTGPRWLIWDHRWGDWSIYTPHDNTFTATLPQNNSVNFVNSRIGNCRSGSLVVQSG